jgi:protein-L-isoaspartate(D-aspartate) O-methyltransferase
MYDTSYDAMRTAMVDRQLQTAGVNDQALLAVLRQVPREHYVPRAKRRMAYTDTALEIVPGRWLIEPMSLALLLNHAQLRAGDRVLIVGASSGYSTAVVKLLAGRVTALESDIALIAMARSNGIAVVDGPLVDGYAADAPYDLILVDGAVAIVPDALLRQLAPSGRLAAVVVGDDGVGRVTVGSYAAGHFAATSFIEAGVHLLPGFARAAQFVF